MARVLDGSRQCGHWKSLKTSAGTRAVGRTYGWVPFRVEFREIVGVGIGGGVKLPTKEEGLAVFAYEDGAFIGLAVDGDCNQKALIMLIRR